MRLGRSQGGAVDANGDAAVLEPVEIASDPPGARVFIGDKAVGVTPYKVGWDAAEDPPTVRVEAPSGFVDADVELLASLRGKTVDVEFKRKATKKRPVQPPPEKKKKGTWL